MSKYYSYLDDFNQRHQLLKLDVEEDVYQEEEEESVSPPTPPQIPRTAPLPDLKSPRGARSVPGDPSAGSGSRSSGNPKVGQAFASTGRGPTLRGQATTTTPLLPKR